MYQNLLPVFTLPMTLCTLVMLMVSQERKQEWCGVGGELERCEEMSFPDRQCWDNIRREEGDSEQGTEEEKEPTIKIVETS